MGWIVDRFGVTLGPIWAYGCDFGVTLASLLTCEGDFGGTLGSLFAYEGDFGATSRPLWGYFLHLRVTLGVLRRHFGVNPGI